MCRQKNISRPLCVDKRTKEQTQSYVIMYLCLKRTKEQTQSYVIMYLCLNKQENIPKPLCKDRRTNPNLCHYVLMSKKNISNLMSLCTYVQRPCTYKFVNCFQISMASRPPAKMKRLNDVPNRNGIL